MNHLNSKFASAVFLLLLSFYIIIIIVKNGGDDMSDFSKLEKIYLSNQECPSCYKDSFLALIKYPEYGRCMECSFENELEIEDKFEEIISDYKE